MIMATPVEVANLSGVSSKVWLTALMLSNSSWNTQMMTGF